MNGHQVPVREYLLVALIAGAAAAAWALGNGRDLNWDFFNYHLYAGFAADGGRIAQDYFPASIQSYLLGYAYVPLARAIMAGWDAWAVQLLLAAQSVPAIIACWFIARRLLPASVWRQQGWRAGMVVAACVSPLFLAELGTSFVDAPTAALVLFALGLVLPADPERAAVRPGLAGVLVGIACALKLTNAAMAPGIAVVVFLFAREGRQLRDTATFCAASALAFAGAYGYWGLLLYQRFGNPFFPMLLNEVFRAPEYFPASVSLDRFRPLNLREFLLRPLYMLDPVANVYTEGRSPDARFLALGVLALPYVWVRRTLPGTTRQPIDAMLLWVVISWPLWLLTSGNGRYAVALAMVTGIVCVRLAGLLWCLRGINMFVVKIAVVMLLVLQIASLAEGTVFRWDGRDTSEVAFFKPRVPAALQDKPHVIVHFNTQSASWLAPFVHGESTMISPMGQYLIKHGTPASEKLHSYLASGKPVVITFPGSADDSEIPGRLAMVRLYSELFGLVPDQNACERVVVGSELRSERPEPAAAKERNEVMHVCAASYSRPLADRTAAQYAARDSLMDRAEDVCPRLFRPQRQQTVCSGGVCSRGYVNTDVTLLSYADGSIVALGFGGAQPAFLGRGDVSFTGAELKCPGPPGRYRPFTAGDAVMARPD